MHEHERVESNQTRSGTETGRERSPSYPPPAVAWRAHSPVTGQPQGSLTRSPPETELTVRVDWLYCSLFFAVGPRLPRRSHQGAPRRSRRRRRIGRGRRSRRKRRRYTEEQEEDEVHWGRGRDGDSTQNVSFNSKTGNRSPLIRPILRSEGLPAKTRICSSETFIL